MPYVQRDNSGNIAGLFANEQSGYADEFLADTDPAVMAYRNPPPLTADQLSTLDQATLNAALAAPGSVVRALGLVTFQEINKLRVLAGQAAYTMPQFTAALKANMR